MGEAYYKYIIFDNIKDVAYIVVLTSSDLFVYTVSLYDSFSVSNCSGTLSSLSLFPSSISPSLHLPLPPLSLFNKNDRFNLFTIFFFLNFFLVSQSNLVKMDTINDVRSNTTWILGLAAGGNVSFFSISPDSGCPSFSKNWQYPSLSLSLSYPLPLSPSFSPLSPISFLNPFL